MFERLKNRLDLAEWEAFIAGGVGRMLGLIARSARETGEFVDLLNRLEVYTVIADFLQENLHLQRPLAKRVALEMVQERDPRFERAREGHPSIDAVTERAKQLIVMIQVVFSQNQESGAEQYCRRTLIWYLRDHQIVRQSTEHQLQWETLPPDVRGEWNAGVSSRDVTFKLYPLES